MDLINLQTGQAGLIALLGYGVVFLGLLLLMVVIIILGKIMVASRKNTAAVPAAEAPAEEVPVRTQESFAAGSAGEIKLYDTDPKDAAMIMAIVANKLGKPLNELRFKSIREVKEGE